MMEAIHEVLAVETALYNWLTPDTPPLYTVYSGIAPDDVEPPFILFAMQTGNDRLGVGDPAARVLTQFTYVVRAYAKGPSFIPVADIADFIDEQVHGATALSYDQRQIRARRIQPIAMREPQDGDWWVSLGGLYELTMGGL
jgi:hypothetical protein